MLLGRGQSSSTLSAARVVVPDTNLMLLLLGSVPAFIGRLCMIAPSASSTIIVSFKTFAFPERSLNFRHKTTALERTSDDAFCD